MQEETDMSLFAFDWLLREFWTEVSTAVVISSRDVYGMQMFKMALGITTRVRHLD